MEHKEPSGKQVTDIKSENRTEEENSEKSSFLSRISNRYVYRIVIGAFAGAFLGMLYWEFIGCNGGSCPITSNPYKTVTIFTVMGGMLARR